MASATPVLDIRGLHTSFFTFMGEVQAVRGVDLQVNQAEIVGVVGESGSGKSVTALSAARLLSDNGKVTRGEVYFDGRDVLALPEKQMRRVRNSGIAMVFQDPMTSLNPTIRVGTQITERIRAFTHTPMREAKRRAVELLAMVKIPEPEKRMHAYPFEMSGGMRQRLMLAIALSMKPRLLIADEPTTALDVTIQNQILRLIKNLRDETGSSILLITHDLGVVAETCQRVAVMYGGQMMEQGSVRDIFYQTAHPYTQGLKASLPSVERVGEKLFSIPGSPPSLLTPPAGCPFADRCRRAMRVCADEAPPVYRLSSSHTAACWLHHPECAQGEEATQ